MKKIAVVLRGHKRTWDYSKKWTLEFFSKVAEQVDYYVVLWRTEVTENSDQLIEDFSSVNLKHLETVSTATEFYNPWLGPAYLSNIASKHIFEEECLSNVNYDMIFDTRPDVAFIRIPNTQFFSIPNAVGCDKVCPIDTDNGDGSVWQGLADQCFTMDSKTHVIWNQRLRLRKHIQDQLNLSTGNHSMLYKYSQIYNINSYVFPWLKTDLVRPNVKDYPAYSIEDFFHSTNLAHNKWNNFSLEEKIKSTLDAGVCVDDYVEAFGVYHRDALELLRSIKKAT